MSREGNYKPTHAEFQPKPTLSNLLDQYLWYMDQIEEAGGEMPPEVEKALAEVEGSLSQKAEGYMRVIERLESEIAERAGKVGYYQEQIDRLKDRNDRTQKKVDQLKTNLIFMLKEVGGKLETPLYKLGVSERSKSLVVKDPNRVPLQFKTFNFITKLPGAELNPGSPQATQILTKALEERGLLEMAENHAGLAGLISDAVCGYLAEALEKITGSQPDNMKMTEAVDKAALKKVVSKNPEAGEKYGVAIEVKPTLTVK